MWHNECIVKLSSGNFDWYDPVFEVEVREDGALYIKAAYEYILQAGTWVDYKVRPYHPDLTYKWEQGEEHES